MYFFQELHAHLNGSVSHDTLKKLVEQKKRKEPDWNSELTSLCFSTSDRANLKE